MDCPPPQETVAKIPEPAQVNHVIEDRRRPCRGSDCRVGLGRGCGCNGSAVNGEDMCISCSRTHTDATGCTKELQVCNMLVQSKCLIELSSPGSTG